MIMNQLDTPMGLSQIAAIILKKWYILVGTVLVCFAASYLLTAYGMEKQYMASAEVFLYKHPEVKGGIYTEAYASTMILKNATYLVSSDHVYKGINKELKKNNFGQINRNRITLETGSAPALYLIKVVDKNPEKAKIAANTIQKLLINDLYLSDTVQVAYAGKDAQLPQTLYRPQMALNLAFGAAAGFAAGILFCLCFPLRLHRSLKTKRKMTSEAKSPE